jgi:hypothetical protein
MGTVSILPKTSLDHNPVSMLAKDGIVKGACDLARVNTHDVALKVWR